MKIPNVTISLSDGEDLAIVFGANATEADVAEVINAVNVLHMGLSKTPVTVLPIERRTKSEIFKVLRGRFLHDFVSVDKFHRKEPEDGAKGDDFNPLMPPDAGSTDRGNPDGPTEGGEPHDQK